MLTVKQSSRLTRTSGSSPSSAHHQSRIKIHSAEYSCGCQAVVSTKIISQLRALLVADAVLPNQAKHVTSEARPFVTMSV